MKSSSNIVQALQHIEMAKQHLESFCLDHPGTKGERLFKTYIQKLQYIPRDLISNPLLPAAVREGVKREVSSDVFAVPAIVEKVALLPPDKREEVEALIESFIK